MLFSFDESALPGAAHPDHAERTIERWMANSDENERGMGRIIEFCNAVGDSKIGIQLAHSGRRGSTERPWEGGRPLKVNKNNIFTIVLI